MGKFLEFQKNLLSRSNSITEKLLLNIEELFNSNFVFRSLKIEEEQSFARKFVIFNIELSISNTFNLP